MKKFTILLLMMNLWFTNYQHANPIVYDPPQDFISEIGFPSGNSWSLELQMYISDNDEHTWLDADNIGFTGRYPAQPRL